MRETELMVGRTYRTGDTLFEIMKITDDVVFYVFVDDHPVKRWWPIQKELLLKTATPYNNYEYAI